MDFFSFTLGQENVIKLRGNENAEPTVFVNGTKTTHEAMQKINPEMIESINVIKDASMLTMYDIPDEKRKDGALFIQLKDNVFAQRFLEENVEKTSFELE